MEQETNQTFLYDAFISYRHTEPDLSFARRLMAMLEGYRAPRSIARRSGVTKIARIFRDREELPTTTDLSESILTALKNSRFLIVVCSPRTPESRWVQKEIEIFRELRGTRYIQALLIEGEPEESFPAPLHFETVKLLNADGSFSEQIRELELLAADIRPDELKGKMRLAYGASAHDDKRIKARSLKLLKTERLRCLAPMFGCKFDELYQRHWRRTLRNVVAASALTIALLASFGVYVAGINSRMAEQSRIAQENEDQARTSAQEAEKQASIAQQNEDMASASAAEAERQRQEAEQKRAVAEQQSAVAEQQKEVAEMQTAIARQQAETARQQRDKALISQSLYLAGLSQQQFAKGDRVLAAMLAQAALPADLNNPDRPYVQEAEAALWNATNSSSAPYKSKTVLKHNGPLNSARFSPDGSRAVTASDDNTAVIWNTANGSRTATLQGHRAAVVYAEFSPDGGRIITSSADGTAIIWDAATGTPVTTMSTDGEIGTALMVKFSPDGSKVIGAGTSGRALVWDAATGKRVAVLQSSAVLVNSAIFSPDGSRVVAALSEKGGVIFDAATGREVLKLTGYDGELHGAAYNHEGSRIMAAADKSALIFDAASGALLYQLEDSEDRSSGCMDLRMRFSPDDRQVLTLSADSSIIIWDTAAGTEIMRLKPEDAGHKVLQASFGPDNSQIIADYAGTEAALAIIWDAASGQEKARLQNPAIEPDAQGPGTSSIRSEFSPDGSKIIVLYGDESAAIWDVAVGDNCSVLSGHTGEVNSIAFSSDGSKILTTSFDNQAILWDAESKRMIKSLVGGYYSGWQAHFNPDGSKIIVSSLDGATVIWDVVNSREMERIPGISGDVAVCKFSSDGSRLLTSIADCVAVIWDFSTGGELVPLASIVSEIVFFDAQFSPDGSKIMTLPMRGQYNGLTQIWDVTTGRRLARLDVIDEEAKFSPDSSKIAAIDSGEALVWDAVTGAELMKFGDADEHRLPEILSPEDMQYYTYMPSELETADHFVESCAFSPDSARFATVPFRGPAVIWDLNTGDEVFELPALEDDHINNLHFSADGSKIATACDDGSATIWDAATGQEIMTLSGHHTPVEDADFNPDGSLVLTSFSDDSSSLWNANSGIELEKLEGTSACFSPDSKEIATSLPDGRVVLWPVFRLEEIIQDAQKLVQNRSFTQQEKHEFFLEQF